MTAIVNAWTHTVCAFPACEEPTSEGVMCALHHNVRVSNFGSWVADRHGEAS